jgi:hypothetical protein
MLPVASGAPPELVGDVVKVPVPPEPMSEPGVSSLLQPASVERRRRERVERVRNEEEV